tara:strand:- start:325 stop:639 length:315 start_codon:yes stop_codon:yes gene_type:complete
MRNTVSIIIGLVFLYGCNSIQSHKIEIDKNFTKVEVEKVIENAHKNGIDLKFETLEFSSQGIIEEISGSVETSAGSGSFRSSEFDHLTISVHSDESKTLEITVE